MKACLTGALLVLVVVMSGCFFDAAEKQLQDLTCDNRALKNMAIYNLGENRVKAAVPLLVELLKERTPKDIRINAIEALGKICDEHAVKALIAVLEEQDRAIRETVVEALGKIKDPRAVDPLIAVLDDRDVRLTAIWALGNIGDRRAVPALTGLLKSSNVYVRYNAVQALKAMGI